MKKFFIAFAVVAATYVLLGSYAMPSAKQSLSAAAAEHHKKIEEASK